MWDEEPQKNNIIDNRLFMGMAGNNNNIVSAVAMTILDAKIQTLINIKLRLHMLKLFCEDFYAFKMSKFFDCTHIAFVSTYVSS
jgi:hypothetical protein